MSEEKFSHTNTVETYTRDQIDQRGHSVLGNPLYTKEAQFSVSRMYYPADEDHPTPTTSVFFSGITTFSCSYCNEYPNFEEGEDGYPRMKTACEYNAKVNPTFKLKVPSGRIVFADSLFNVMPKPESTHDYNSALGRANYYAKCEANGIAYGCVLNTSPDLYLDKETNELIVASPEWDENDEEVFPETWEKLGGFITDLWAYSIVDADNYIAHGGKPDEDKYIETATIPAGEYTFVHYADNPDFDEDDEGVVIFAKATFAPLNPTAAIS